MTGSGPGAPTPLLDRPARVAVAAGTAVAVVVFWLVATVGRPWQLFARGPFSSDFFDVQARSLLEGRLDVPASVMGIEGFRVGDLTQMYFGLGPAVLRLPVALFGDGTSGRLTVISQLLAIVVLGVATGRLLARARRAVVGPDAGPGPAWSYAVVPAAAALCTPVLFLASRAVVYHEAELWGAAAGLAGIDLALAWWEDRRSARLVAAAAVGAFAFSCRPSSGMAPLLALGGFAVVLAFRRELRTAAAAVAAAAVGALAYVAVNLARFGTLLSLPFEDQVFSRTDAARQAALAANDGTLFGLRFAPTTALQYLGPLPSVRPDRLFPFVDWGPRARIVGDVTFDTVDRTTSLPAAAPVAVLLGLVGVWWVLRRDRSWGWRVTAAAAVAGTAGTFTIGFIAHRYLVDMVPALVVPAVVGWWVTAGWLAERPRWLRRTLVATAAVVSVVASAGQAGLALRARHLVILPDETERLDFVRFRYDLDDRLRGGPPPRVTVLAEDPAPGPAGEASVPDLPEGSLVVVGDCRALYLVEGRGWVGLEWADDTDLRQVLRPTPRTAAGLGVRPVEVVRGDGWAIRADPVRPARDGRVRFRLEVPGLDLDVPGDETVVVGADDVVDVVADPTSSTVRVRVDGRTALSTTFLPVRGLSRAPGWVPVDVPEPWCRSLLDRRRSTG